MVTIHNPPRFPNNEIKIRVIRPDHFLCGKIGVVREINSLISDKTELSVYFVEENILAKLSIYQVEKC